MPATNAEQQLALLTVKVAAGAAALEAAKGDVDDAAYKKTCAMILKVYRQGVRSLKADAREDKEPTDKAKALADLDLTNQEYKAVFHSAAKYSGPVPGKPGSPSGGGLHLVATPEASTATCHRQLPGN